jgi:hypothetical protein
MRVSDMRPQRTAHPAFVLAGIASFYLVWQLSLLTACHEWSSLRWSPGVRFELLHSLGVTVVVALVALLPYWRRRRSLWLHLLCWTGVAAALVVRATDWVVYRHSGLHISLLVGQHAHGSALRMVFGYIPIAELAAPLAALAFTAWLARRSFAGVGRIVLSPKAALPFVAALGAIWWAAWNTDKPHVEHATTGPEWTLFRSLKQSWWESKCLADAKCAEGLNTLDENIRRKLTRFGVRVNPREWFPLVKPFVYRKPIPFATTPQKTARPNVVVILMESMSEYFVGSYHPERPSMTPNLDDFARRSTRVLNYYNATTPTVTSLVAELCSLYSPSGHAEFGKEYFGSLLCAGNLLGRYGYQSTFIRGIEKSYANVGPFLESHGFKVTDLWDIYAQTGKAAHSWGYSDHELLEYLQRFMEENAAQPFFAGITTVDLHLPFNWTPVPTIVPGPEGQLLNIVHSTDDAFGIFWRWFQQSKFRDNTILVVTGDHAIFPVPEYRQLRGSDWTPSYYDRLPLLIYAPGYQLPRTWEPPIATSVDLLPTLLHLLGINDANPFEGLSIFDDQTGRTGALGDNVEFLYSNQLDAGGQRVIDNFSPNCASPPSSDDSFVLTECEQTAWHNWKLRLINQKRIWRDRPRS